MQEGISGPLLLPEGRDELQARPAGIFHLSATRFLVSRLRGLAERLLETRPHPPGRLGPWGQAATASLGSWEGPRTPAYCCLCPWESQSLPSRLGSPGPPACFLCSPSSPPQPLLEKVLPGEPPSMPLAWTPDLA